jgi:tetratricopeptide (TPR) repeat protein
MQVRDSVQPRPGEQFVEIDPFGCPYCGGPVAGGPPQCSRCGRSVELRLRRRPGGAALGWLIAFILVLGIAAWLQGLFLAQMVGSADQLPQWLDQTIFKLVIGPAFFNSDGIGDELAEIAALLTQVHYVLACLCVVAAVGLALRSRVVYFATFFLLILMVAAPVAGLLKGLTGWVPVIFLFGLMAFGARWLADIAPVFEWKTRSYSADLDRDLKTHVDYYNRGRHYSEIEMWAKAAAHLRIATQLAPGQAPYHAALASALAQLEYPAAAMTAADRALALDPDDRALRAFRNTLAELEESS